MRSTRAGTSVASVGSPTQISLPGSWSRQRSLQTTGMASSTGRLYSPPVRLRELGLRIGRREAGETNSIADVPGIRVGHVTVWRDEPEPPEGRGVARTGVTAIVPASLPLRAGVAVLNGAGEVTGSHEIREWGLLETPVYLTATMALGRGYAGAGEGAGGGGRGGRGGGRVCGHRGGRGVRRRLAEGGSGGSSRGWGRGGGRERRDGL